MERIHLDLTKSYDILLGDGLINHVFDIINPLCSNRNVAIITDDNVDKLYGDVLFNQLKDNHYSVVKFVFPNGESSKNINTLSDILEFLASNNFKRNDCLIALGGGVVGDITGFASAVYMRGINFIQIPTTLLSMVDASIGGKTAIDLKAGKNLAGAFWQPSLVICDTDIIAHLPSDIFKEGMGEVLKYEVIDNFGIFSDVLNDSIKSNLITIILNCINSKKNVVEKDEFETKGIRKVLNVGHTFAHGLEKLSEYNISHGVAVGTGLVWEAGIAYQKGLCKKEVFELIKKCVVKTELLVDFDYDFADLIGAMKKDKKNDDDLISFMLPKQLGDCVEIKIGPKELLPILENVRKMI